ncbi:hypothetical protein CK228_31185 [Mesorhizobium sp. WSM4312]|nr:hypothetical protein CK228_31185 [Mesorhizobium sp. WSM4312]
MNPGKMMPAVDKWNCKGIFDGGSKSSPPGIEPPLEGAGWIHEVRRLSLANDHRLIRDLASVAGWMRAFARLMNCVGLANYTAFHGSSHPASHFLIGLAEKW